MPLTGRTGRSLMAAREGLPSKGLWVRVTRGTETKRCDEECTTRAWSGRGRCQAGAGSAWRRVERGRSVRRRDRGRSRQWSTLGPGPEPARVGAAPGRGDAPRQNGALAGVVTAPGREDARGKRAKRGRGRGRERRKGVQGGRGEPAIRTGHAATGGTGRFPVGGKKARWERRGKGGGGGGSVGAWACEKKKKKKRGSAWEQGRAVEKRGDAWVHGRARKGKKKTPHARPFFFLTGPCPLRTRLPHRLRRRRRNPRRRCVFP